MKKVFWYFVFLLRVLFVVWTPFAIVYIIPYFQNLYPFIEKQRLIFYMVLVVISGVFFKYYLGELIWILQVNHKLSNLLKLKSLKSNFNVSQDMLEMPIYSSTNDNLLIDGEVESFYHDHIKSSFHSKQNVVILLNGEFGVGKSSFINLLIEKIQGSQNDYTFLCNEDISIIKISALKFISFSTTDSDDSKLKEFANYISSHFLSSEKKIFSSFFNSLKEANLKFGGVELKLENIFKINVSQSNFSLNKYLLIIEDIDRLNKENLTALIKILYLIHDIPNLVTILPLSKQTINDIDNDNLGIQKFINLTENMPRHYTSLMISKNVINNDLINKYLSDYFYKNQIIASYTDELSQNVLTILVSYFECILAYVLYERNVSYRDIKSLNYEKITSDNSSIYISDLVLNSLSDIFPDILKYEIYKHLLLIKENKGKELIGCYDKLFNSLLSCLNSDQIKKYVFTSYRKYADYFFALLFLNDSSNYSCVFGGKKIYHVFNWIDEERVSLHWFDNQELIKFSVLFFPSITSIEPQKDNFGFSTKIIQSAYMIFVLAVVNSIIKKLSPELLNFIVENGRVVNFFESYVPMSEESLRVYSGLGDRVFKNYPLLLNIGDSINVDINSSLFQIREKCMTFLDGNNKSIEEMDNKIRTILFEVGEIYLSTAIDLGLIEVD